MFSVCDIEKIIKDNTFHLSNENWYLLNARRKTKTSDHTQLALREYAHFFSFYFNFQQKECMNNVYSFIYSTSYHRM